MLDDNPPSGNLSGRASLSDYAKVLRLAGGRGASVLHRVQDLLHLLRELVHDDRLVADDLRQVRLVHEVAVAGVDRGRRAILEVDLARALQETVGR